LAQLERALKTVYGQRDSEFVTLSPPRPREGAENLKPNGLRETPHLARGISRTRVSAPHVLLGGDGVEISAELLFGVGFEFQEHDSVAELGVTGDDASANDDRGTVEP
jgi:hypothetical protein